MLPDRKLSENFTLHELLRSATAERNPDLRKQQWSPGKKVVANLQYLATVWLQPVRDLLRCRITVTSGYRCPWLNGIVGGSERSQHKVGQAADLQISEDFVSADRHAAARRQVQVQFVAATGVGIGFKANANFYLFAATVLALEKFDIDQVIHEYGEGYGRPAWIHGAASTKKSKRQVLVIGPYSKPKTRIVTPSEALA